jgi:hypothetical protein
MALVIYTVRHCEEAVKGKYFKIGAEFTGVNSAREGFDLAQILDGMLSLPPECAPGKV